MSVSGDVGTQAIKDSAVTASEIATGAVTSAKILDATIAAADLVANTIDKASLALAVLQYADVTLTTAQILALFTTPVSLVAAQGVGKIILVDSIYASMTYVSATYSANAAGFTVRYTNGSGQSCQCTVTQAFVQQTASAVYSIRAGATGIVPVDNAAIVIYADTANPTTGDSAIKVRTYYRVVNNPNS